MTPFQRIQSIIGYTNYEIATVLGVSERTVVRMRKRPDDDGPEIRLLKILAGVISKEDVIKKTGRLHKIGALDNL